MAPWEVNWVGANVAGSCIYNCDCQSPHCGGPVYIAEGAKPPAIGGPLAKEYTGDGTPGVGIFIGEGEKLAAGGEFCWLGMPTGGIVCGDAVSSETCGANTFGLFPDVSYVCVVLGSRWTIRVKIPYDALADFVTVLKFCSMACASSITL
ncbi:hypothetical protein HG531_002501 [Fusarium graminearum]|nr:hypothetical protein HG531_002501 [Fusarium graminearum]